jgi:hypothetical protein
MTPDQMRQLAERLLEPQTLADLLNDRRTAASLLRQIAEQKPVAYFCWRENNEHWWESIGPWLNTKTHGQPVYLYALPPATPEEEK